MTYFVPMVAFLVKPVSPDFHARVQKCVFYGIGDNKRLKLIVLTVSKQADMIDLL